MCALPAGLAADRWNRKWLMIGADGVRVLALGGLAVAILADGVALWAIVLVAYIGTMVWTIWISLTGSKLLPVQCTKALK